MLTKFIQSLDSKFQSVETTLKDLQASLQNLENKGDNLCKHLMERPQGSIPSYIKTDPREHVKAITMKSS